MSRRASVSNVVAKSTVVQLSSYVVRQEDGLTTENRRACESLNED